MLRWVINRVNIWVIIVSALIAGALIVLFGLLVLFLPIPTAQSPDTQAALVVIPAPSPTLTPTHPVETLTPTRPPSVGGISIGSYVQISGTEGEGLRLRSGPGTSNPPRLLGMDAEVFKVVDGPKMADDYTWWYLEAPYDPGRSGWAASKYLRVVNAPDLPTPTP